MFENLRIFRGLFLFARARDCSKICVIYRGNRIGVAVLCAVCVIGRTKLVGIVVQWSLRFLSQWLYRRGVSAYFLLLSRFCQCSNDAALRRVRIEQNVASSRQCWSSGLKCVGNCVWRLRASGN